LSKSEILEKQTAKLLDMKYKGEREVTWNAKILDPDNPSQKRQVDILVENDNEVIHAECRHHKAPQDVKWIEELLGRRISLGPDGMIAVSSSGFTAGAKLKAERYGITLRDVIRFNSEELDQLNISKATIRVEQIKYHGLHFAFMLKPKSTNIDISLKDIIPYLNEIAFFDEYPKLIGDLIENQFGATTPVDKKIKVGFILPFNFPLEVKNHCLHAVKITATVSREINDIDISDIALFGSPEETSDVRSEIVEELNVKNWAVFHSNGISNYCIDVSSMENHPNNHIRSVFINVNPKKKNILEIVGIKSSVFMDRIEPVAIQFGYHN